MSFKAQKAAAAIAILVWPLAAWDAKWRLAFLMRRRGVFVLDEAAGDLAHQPLIIIAGQGSVAIEANIVTHLSVSFELG
jgi:hypothetical protein